MTDHTFPTLDAALNDLARVRDQLTTVEAAYSEMETAFKIEAAPVRQRRDALRQDEAAAYGAVTAAAFEAFNTTGDHKPDDDVSIRIITRVDYDAPALIAWAAANGYLHLLKISVDEKALETALKAGHPDGLSAFARLVTEPKPYVSTKLGHRLITNTP